MKKHAPIIASGKKFQNILHIIDDSPKNKDASIGINITMPATMNI